MASPDCPIRTGTGYVQAVTSADDWVTPDGGPLILIPRALYPLWRGTSGTTLEGEVVLQEPGRGSQADYERACAATRDTRAGLVTVGDGEALAIGGPLISAAWLPADAGGAVVLDQSGATELSAARAALEADGEWEPLDVTLEVTQPEWLLLAATEEDEPRCGQIALRLEPGRYQVRWRSRDDDSLRADLLQLVRAGRARKKKLAARARAAAPRAGALDRLLAAGSDAELLGAKAALYRAGAWTADRAEAAALALERVRDPESRLLLVTRLVDPPLLLSRAGQEALLARVQRDPDRRLLDAVLGRFELDASDGLVRSMIADGLVAGRVEGLMWQLDRSPLSVSTWHALLAEVPARVALPHAVRLLSRQVWRWREQSTLRFMTRCALGVEPVARAPEVRQALLLALNALAIDARGREGLGWLAVDRRSGFAFFSHLELLLEALIGLLGDERLLAHRGTQLWLKTTLAASGADLAAVAEFRSSPLREPFLAALRRLGERAELIAGLGDQLAARLSEWSRGSG